jgi:hypothetical protein
MFDLIALRLVHVKCCNTLPTTSWEPKRLQHHEILANMGHANTRESDVAIAKWPRKLSYTPLAHTLLLNDSSCWFSISYQIQLATHINIFAMQALHLLLHRIWIIFGFHPRHVMHLQHHNHDRCNTNDTWLKLKLFTTCTGWNRLMSLGPPN